MTTAIIAEAGAANRATLRRRIAAHCPDVLVIGEAKDASETISLTRNLRPGILFLDAEMPQAAGHSLFGLVESRQFAVVYLTDHEQLGEGAGGGPHAPVWLIKPFGVNALVEAVRAAQRRKKSPAPAENSEVHFRDHQASQRLALPSMNGLQFLDICEIVYLEANSNYTLLYLTSKISMLVSKSLKEFEELLPPVFIRIHHSCIINKNLVSKYIRGEGGQVQMKNGTLLAVARRKKDEFLREMSLG